ncbi:MAG: hypothetical protein ACFB50_18965 [Rubrobacteraceae bacterium]
MRTYSHTLLTLAAVRRIEPLAPAPAVLGSVLPDVPVAAGGAWLWARRGGFTRDQLQQEACAKQSFAIPDTALHSALPVAATLVLYALPNVRKLDRRRFLPAFLLGWAGHVLLDTLTHGKDARPLFWPLSGRRFSSPVSYWERGRGARLFALVEPAVALFVAARILRARAR